MDAPDGVHSTTWRLSGRGIPKIADAILLVDIPGVLKARMAKIKCLRTLVVELNRLENRLFLANVTMPR
jgi:hypothetical protein